jgi:Mg2+ and Co2+ transporter CorA
MDQIQKMMKSHISEMQSQLLEGFKSISDKVNSMEQRLNTSDARVTKLTSKNEAEKSMKDRFDRDNRD